MNHNDNNMSNNESQKDSYYSYREEHPENEIMFNQVFKIYKFKLDKIRIYYDSQSQIEKFWQLLDKNFEGEIEKKSFVLLFSKIYKLILPVYNHNEIESFIEDEWKLSTKGRSTLDYERFCKYLFKFVHTWATHINKEEYVDFLKLIYQRITKYVKLKQDMTEIYFIPSIRVKINKLLTEKEFDDKTWEYFYNKETMDDHLMEYPSDFNMEAHDASISERNMKRRPLMGEEYLTKSHIIIYTEESFYENEEEMKNLGLCESIRPILMPDNEIVLWGYPTQYIISMFKNEINILKNNIHKKNFDMEFNIDNYSSNSNHPKMYFYFANENLTQSLISRLDGNSSFIMTRDYFSLFEEVEIQSDFTDEELNIYNNLRRNSQLDRYLNFQEIITPNGKEFVNIDQLIIPPTYKKALENTITNQKIGIKSKLWKEKISDKITAIIKNKFGLIQKKLQYFVMNSSSYSSVIEIINQEIDIEKGKKFSDISDDYEYFKNFETKKGIPKEKWDSDYDIIEEANKKSPVILVIGPPFCGKSKICKKIEEDLNMVYLDPIKYLDNIMTKVAKFEEDMLNWEETIEEEVNQEDGVENSQIILKKQRPGLDSVLNPLELSVYIELIEGKAISDENLTNVFKNIINSNNSQTKGLIIDQNSAVTDISFAEQILNMHYGNVNIDYVIELKIPNDELLFRKNSMKFNLKTLDIITSRDIELMSNPKQKKKEYFPDEPKDDEEGDSEPVEVTEEIKELIPKEDDLREIKNFDEIFRNQYDYYYNIQYPKFKEIISNLKKNYYIEINLTGLDYDDAADLIKRKLDFVNPPRSLPSQLEEADYKSLLTLNLDGISPFRRWSLWKQIDPVALKDNSVIYSGSTSFAAEYCQRVFLFINEENRNKFLENPKYYLKTPPEVPKKYRVCIIGPSKSGKNTVADILSKIYSWKKINLEDIYESVKEYQKNLLEPEPNSVYSSRIHFSANEFKELITTNKKGEKKPENFYSKIVFMLDYLGYKLDRKKTYQEFLKDMKYNEDKLNHLFNLIRKQKEEEMNAELNNNQEVELIPGESSVNMINDINKSINVPNEIVNSDVPLQEDLDPFPPEEDYNIDDLRSDEFYYAFNEDGTYPRAGGFIVINHPNSQEEIDKFLEFNIIFDKVIYLVDQSEEQPKELALRRIPNFIKLDEDKQQYELEKLKSEIAKYDETLASLREKYSQNNEDCVIEVNCADTLENIKIKLIQTLDPFYIRPDQEDKTYNQSDLNSEEKVPIPRGEYAIFCPVTYKDEKWLFYSPEEFEVQVNHRIYRFASEKEMEKFKLNPYPYLNIIINRNELGYNSMNPVKIFPPHIFITGYQGGGVTFYANLLSKEYKLKKKELKKEFMEIWTDQGLKRKQYRTINKKEELTKKNEEIIQSNALNPDSDPQDLIDIENELANDPTLDEESEGFNSAENDRVIFKNLFSPDTPSVYDATWYDVDEKIQTNLLEFMIDTKRVPNVFVIVKVSLRTVLERHLLLDQIKNHHKHLQDKSLQKKKAELEKYILGKKEEILEKLKEDLLEMSEMNVSNINASNLISNISNNHHLPDLQEIKIDLTQEEIDEIMLAPDPDLPELETLIAQEKEKLTTRYEQNQNFINGFIESLKEKLIPVIEISNDFKSENVCKNLLHQLRPFIYNRENFIEKQLVQKVPQLSLRKRQEILNSQIYKKSNNNTLSPVAPEKLLPLANHCVIYRDRLYFFNNEEEMKIFCEEPLKYRTGNEFPYDCYPVTNSISGKRNIIYSVGVTKSGKTTISKVLKDLGYYRLSLRKAIYDVINTLRDCLLKREIVDIITSGSSIDDGLAARIISRRISMEDLCYRNIVIDGFPFTLGQARLISEIDNDLNPTFVFVSDADAKTILKRCKEQKGFKGMINIIHERLHNTSDHLKDIIDLFKNREIDIKYLNTEKSIWYLKDYITSTLENKMRSELRFANHYNSGKPALLKNMLPNKILRNIIKLQKELQKLFLYSPVSLKVDNEFHYNKTISNSQDNFIIFYNKNFYFLRSQEEVNLFIKNSNLYDSFLYRAKEDIKPPCIMSFEKIARIIYSENENDQENTEENSNHAIHLERDVSRNFEFQSCCPVTFSQEQTLKEGKLQYVALYKEKLYRFDNAEKMLKFCTSPDKYCSLALPVKKNIEIDDDPKQIEHKVNFDNAVNYLEVNFGSLITKGMLELNKNRIKYPYLSVKETAIKYLALFLKSNNPNNNEYAKTKYTKKFEEFIKNSKLPLELSNTYDKYNKEKHNPLRKQLIRKQLDNFAVKYDELREKAKNQKNTRFEDFFKN